MTRTLARTPGWAGLAALALSSLAVPLTAASPAAAAQDDPSSVQLANSKATDWVAKHEGKIKLADGDRVVRAATLTGSGDTVAVAYERTHRGLPVFGGDFVVVTDEAGRVLNSTVAQTKPIEVASLEPSVSPADAVSAAGTRFDSVDAASEPEKIVYALGAEPRLAWKVAVSGVQGGDRAGEDVYVDAATGEVVDHTVTLLHGTGDGWINGPDPLPLRTTQSGSTFLMKDAQIPGLHCGQTGQTVPLSGTDDAWGNGVGTSIETGCADALYGVQTMSSMLSEWLGRNGPKGDGTSWPIYVGLNDQNAFYCNGQVDCSGRNEVWMGKNPSGQWVTSLDVVGHEYGHGVDDYTPSGISRKGTQEFVGDVMGALTEFYDNQPATFDPPDWLIGEEVNLGGSGEIRNMANPTAEGHPVCYTTAIDTTQVHAAAGPGDHWFYLLSNGGTSRCDSTAVTGIGVQKAGKIFYDAMLMKTTASGYQSYRKWTLQAAKNLYPTSCVEFDAVKLAWDAINVPAQTGEATCGTTPPPPPPPPPGNLLVNPGFESGAASWSATSGVINTNTGRPARTGSWKAWLGGNGVTSTESVSQTVTIPATATAANLSYWIRTDTAETGSTVYDRMRVQIVVGGVVTTLRTFTNVGTNPTYTQFSHSLLAHKGKAVTVRLLMNEDSTLQTSFVVDDTAVSVS
ncbi:M4 family metallopeptidase [Nocardioides sp.]|uniref:M4 family metallopeptidase n=1 Tax=Nocardioides sp. TaxID=35761 RepID=UPI002BBFA8D8|nr:M4 family metallopeptidase [Nocardioides sp.]HXH78430.1 M4 family metallopeptidase [Nocardioides sp.]